MRKRAISVDEDTGFAMPVGMWEKLYKLLVDGGKPEPSLAASIGVKKGELQSMVGASRLMPGGFGCLGSIEPLLTQSEMIKSAAKHRIRKVKR